MPVVADLRGRFEGRLVVLEALSPEHEEGLFAATQGGELFTWFPQDIGESREHMHSWIASSIQAAEQGREVPFVILETRTGAPIGSTRFLEIRLEHLRVEIGWTWMAKRVWSSGANVEAKLLLLTHAFERVGCRRVEFKTDARNQRSRGALGAVGAHLEGIFRKHMVVRDGAPRDSAYYSVIDEEWPQIRAGLEARLQTVIR